jgi:hypothetical protein
MEAQRGSPLALIFAGPSDVPKGGRGDTVVPTTTGHRLCPNNNLAGQHRRGGDTGQAQRTSLVPADARTGNCEQPWSSLVMMSE